MRTYIFLVKMKWDREKLPIEKHHYFCNLIVQFRMKLTIQESCQRSSRRHAFTLGFLQKMCGTLGLCFKVSKDVQYKWIPLNKNRFLLMVLLILVLQYIDWNFFNLWSWFANSCVKTLNKPNKLGTMMDLNW